MSNCKGGRGERFFALSTDLDHYAYPDISALVDSTTR